MIQQNLRRHSYIRIELKCPSAGTQASVVGLPFRWRSPQRPPHSHCSNTYPNLSWSECPRVRVSVSGIEPIRITRRCGRVGRLQQRSTPWHRLLRSFYWVQALPAAPSDSGLALAAWYPARLPRPRLQQVPVPTRPRPRPRRVRTTPAAVPAPPAPRPGSCISGWQPGKVGPGYFVANQAYTPSCCQPEVVAADSPVDDYATYEQCGRNFRNARADCSDHLRRVWRGGHGNPGGAILADARRRFSGQLGSGCRPLALPTNNGAATPPLRGDPCRRATRA